MGVEEGEEEESGYGVQLVGNQGGGCREAYDVRSSEVEENGTLRYGWVKIQPTGMAFDRYSTSSVGRRSSAAEAYIGRGW
jgi:hypothetical protein